MVAGSDDAFRRRFARLSRTEQAAFVADLFRARGWNARVDGTTIEATDGTRTQVVAIGSPGAREDIDRVVQASDAGTGPVGRIRGWFDPTDTERADSLSVAELRMQLLYAIDREDASAIARKHFETPLFTADDDHQSAGVAASGVLVGVVTLLAVLALAIGLVLSGGVDLLDRSGYIGDRSSDAPSVPGDSENDGGAAETNGATTGTNGDSTGTDGNDRPGAETDEPPNDDPSADEPTATGPSADTGSERLTADDLRDIDTLVAAHVEQTASIDNATVWVAYEGPEATAVHGGQDADGDDRDRVIYRLRIDEDGQAYGTGTEQYADYRSVVDVADRSYRTTTGRTFQHSNARTFPTGTTSEQPGAEGGGATEQVPPAPDRVLGELGVPLLRTYLEEDTTDVETIDDIGTSGGDGWTLTVNDGGDRRFVLVSTEPPQPLGDETTSYRATALVRPSGFVKRFEVTYVGGSAPSRIEYVFEDGHHDDPEWIDTAATDSGE